MVKLTTDFDMETILYTLLLLSVLYLIFTVKHLREDMGYMENKIHNLENLIKSNTDKIYDIEERVSQGGYKGGYTGGAYGRKSTNQYRELLETAISKGIVYCNYGWSVSKTLLSKAQGEANRLLEGSIRPTYLRAKRYLQGIVYRVKKGQEVISYQRAEDVYRERIK
jgi:hypothetical protein